MPPSFPSNTKCFCRWCSDSEDLFSLQLCGCDVLLGKLFFASGLLRMCREHFREQICIFRACTIRPKVALVSSTTKASATLGGKAMFVMLFHEWQNPELLRGYLYFLNTLLILMIFQNKYGRSVTVGMYESHNLVLIKYVVCSVLPYAALWASCRLPIEGFSAAEMHLLLLKLVLADPACTK